ncbi:MAG: DUF3501 family protein [Rhodanobacter sp.]|jgi:hypothetical protein|nr:DUF3501 family protein [Rhodanobacter sp.]
MHKLTPDDLLTLEAYARERPQFRRAVLEHKKHRVLHLGEHLTLLFEDRRTVQYQIQEMLRIERIFEAAGIQDELDAYNPLIPDGGNLKATLLVEYEDEQQRRRELQRLRGLEDHIELQVDGDTVTAIADEDMPRSNDDKTSAVHFLRFELTPAMRTAWNTGAPVVLRSTHLAALLAATLNPEQRCALAADFH